MKSGRSDAHRTLVFPNGGFGDVIQVSGVFELSKLLQPDVEVHCAVYARNHADLLQNHPFLDGILPVKFTLEGRKNPIRLVRQFIKHYRVMKPFDRAYMTINPRSLGWTATLPLKLRKIPRMICDDSRPDRPDCPVYELYQRLYCDMLGVAAQPVFQPKLYLLPEEMEAGRRVIESLGLDPEKLAIMAYDAGMPLKQIPVQTAVTICRILADRGHQILLIKGSSNPAAAHDIMDSAGFPMKALEVGGSIRQLMMVIAHARIVAAPDTGIAHMASALDVPVISFFGPTHPAFRPAGDRIYLIQKSLGCPNRDRARGCWATCTHRDHTGGDRPGPCMNWFKPSEIETALNHLSGKGGD